ncbi:MAG: hypothetical protein Q9187_002592 [Circinaria calcarea]
MEMFRKHNHKFGWRRSEEEKDKGDDEQRDYTLSKANTLAEGLASSAGPNLPAKRASEPSTSRSESITPDQVQRNASVTSNAGSEFPASVSHIGQSSTINTSSTSDPLGLTLVYISPDPLLDLIFVHGLGGTSTGTWSWERDPANFWPPWLGRDVELSRSRIFSFGYNASFVGNYTSFNILDFSKDLLFRMKTFSNEYQHDDPPIGKAHPQTISQFPEF